MCNWVSKPKISPSGPFQKKFATPCWRGYPHRYAHLRAPSSGTLSATAGYSSDTGELDGMPPCLRDPDRASPRARYWTHRSRQSPVSSPEACQGWSPCNVGLEGRSHHNRRQLNEDHASWKDSVFMQGRLAGSVGTAGDSRSQGHEFKPTLGVGPT